MATSQEHRSKALHNEKLLDFCQLSDGEFVDWAVTVLFYGALHWMRALAAQEGYEIKRYRGKESEEEVFRGSGVFSEQAYAWYRQMKDDSREARYDMKQFSNFDFQDLRQNNFEPFKLFVTSKLRS